MGDRPDDLRAALDFLAGTGVALVITSGGLGPTADDLTAEVVGEFQGRPSIGGPRAGAADRRGRRAARWPAAAGGPIPSATAAGVRKQARVPEGATVLEPVGTAPGLVVPPADGRGRSDGARAARAARGAAGHVAGGASPPRRPGGRWPGRAELRQETVRLWGTLEAQLAATLREHEDELAGLEITTCLRDGELEIVTRFAPDAQPAYDRLAAVLAEELRRHAVLHRARPSTTSWPAAFADRGLTVATAESCTGGLLAARLTERPGSSAWVLGGVAAYANSAKEQLLDVPARSWPSTARSAPRWRSPWPRARGRGSAPTSGSASPGSPGRAAGRRRSRSAPCTSAWPGRTGASCARCGCPARGRPCGNAPSRWRCTCCAPCCWAAHPPEPTVVSRGVGPEGPRSSDEAAQRRR